jgi:hypothetical protein
MTQDSIQIAPKGGVAGDQDIASIRWLFLDFDPERPTDTSATAAEKACAREQMEKAHAHFTELGWSEPLEADSGNGCHLLYAVELPNDDVSRRLLKSVTESAAELFSTDEVKLDTTVCNPARITRLYGSMNRKGANTEERPWRRSCLLSVPVPSLLQEERSGEN